MKRIYLVIAILIIFLGLGAEYVFKRQAPANAQAQNAGVASAQTNPMPEDAQAIPAEKKDVDVAGISAKHSTVAMLSRHHRGLHRRYARIERSHPGKSHEAPLLAEGELDQPAVESAKTYFAYTTTPKAKTCDKQYVYEIARDDNSAYSSNKVRFGPEIGLNQNNLVDNGTSNIATLGFHVGVAMDVKLGEDVSFQPILRYMVKGNRLQSTMDVDTREKLSLNYIELPANIVFKLGNVNNSRFIIGAGPYAAYLVSAHDKFQTSAPGDVLGEVPATPAYRADKIRKFDWGLNGFIGCETPEGIYAKAGVEVGARNLQQNTDNSWSNRNFNVLVSVGYLFGSNK